MSDLRTTYLGLPLRSPIVASAGPVTGNPAMWGRLEDAGVGAIVLPSLFEEEVEHDVFSLAGSHTSNGSVSADLLTFYPDLDAIAAGPDRHLNLVEDAAQRLTVPVIASINGTTPGGWVRYARALESAGAAALELNVYETVCNPRRTAAEVEEQLLQLVGEVRAVTRIPLAVKLSPWYTSLGHLVGRLFGLGVDGVVLFSRFYQPDIDIDAVDVAPRLRLSSSGDVNLSIHWIGSLRGSVRGSLAGSSGVHTGDDVVKLLLAGADVVMTTSALLARGPEHAAVLSDRVVEWMEAHGYTSVQQMRGAVSRANVADPGVYDRLNYFQVLRSWSVGSGQFPA